MVTHDWHWYVGRGNELLLDLDSERALGYAMDRLERNIEEGFLRVKEDPYVERSSTPGHYHMIVTLRKPLDAVDRAVWELHLGGDLVRAQYNLMRISRGVNGTSDFLIADRPYPGFRPPDGVCRCPEEKHKEKTVTDKCPVMRELLGRECSAQYFAIRPKNSIPVGRIPLSTFGGGKYAKKKT